MVIINGAYYPDEDYPELMMPQDNHDNYPEKRPNPNAVPPQRQPPRPRDEGYPEESYDQGYEQHSQGYAPQYPAERVPVRPRRGDSFDIGSGEEQIMGSNQDLGTLLSNPGALIGALGLTPTQAANLRSLIVAGGTGAVHRFLSDHFGDEISGAIGGFVSGYVAKRIVKRTIRRRAPNPNPYPYDPQGTL